MSPNDIGMYTHFRHSAMLSAVRTLYKELLVMALGYREGMSLAPSKLRNMFVALVRIDVADVKTLLQCLPRGALRSFMP